MASFNKVLLLGNLGRDPELRYTGSGMAQCSMSLATTKTRKDASGAKVSQSEWHKLCAWGKTAEFCGQWLKKGQLVFCEGEIQSRKYTDKQGQERTVYEIIVSRIEFAGAKEPSAAYAQADSYGAYAEPTQPSRAYPEPAQQPDPAHERERTLQNGYDEGVKAAAIDPDEIPF